MSLCVDYAVVLARRWGHLRRFQAYITSLFLFRCRTVFTCFSHVVIALLLHFNIYIYIFRFFHIFFCTIFLACWAKIYLNYSVWLNSLTDARQLLFAECLSFWSLLFACFPFPPAPALASATFYATLPKLIHAVTDNSAHTNNTHTHIHRHRHT